MFKKLFTILLIISLAEISYSQEIYNSSDVKLKSPLKQSWNFKSDGLILNEHFAGDVCYLNTILSVTAVSTKDGSQIWKHEFPKDKSISSVVTFNDKYGVYLNYKKGESAIILIDLATGKEKWKVKSKTEWHKPTPFLNDKFAIVLAGEPKDWESKNDYFEMDLSSSKLTAYNLNDGKVAWQSEINDEESDLLSVTNEYAYMSFDFDVADNGLPKNKLNAFSAVDGKELWDYNPSGMTNKVFIGGVTVFNNALYTYPEYGGNGQIARIDLKSGDEKWNFGVYGQREVFFTNENIYSCSNTWIASKLSNGDKQFTKVFIKESFWKGMGTAFGSAFANSFIGRMVSTVGNIASLFTSSTNEKITFIPTQQWFVNLLRENLANDKGLFSIYTGEDYPKVFLMSNKSDENIIEYKYTVKTKDLCMANGTNDNHLFLSSKGKVFTMDISTGKVDWEMDFSNGATTSFGLIIKNDKMYLFTDKGVSQLVNE